VLREGDRERLAELPSVPSGLAKRARIVLLAADGMPNSQIARTAGVSRPMVIGWQDRYLRGRQLRRAQAPGREGMAARQPADHSALQPDRLLLAQHR
jgi:hypothetical protein